MSPYRQYRILIDIHEYPNEWLVYPHYARSQMFAAVSSFCFLRR